MNRHVMHFQLGPVQDFIADARRLRDYWAGSFLLSLLSAHAMMAARKAGATIIFPVVEHDALLKALESNDPGADAYIGSVPNRFKADISDVVDHAAVAKACADAVRSAWQALCDEVWNTHLRTASEAFHNAKGDENPTRIIWRRQTENFWDILWVHGLSDGHDGKWLDIRKNWRRLRPDAIEGGEHCRLIGQLQELSGVPRIGHGSRKRREAFWNTVRSTSKISMLDLGDGEFLSAIGFIKRMFPVIAVRSPTGIPGVLPWKPGGKVPIRSWPSTSYIAALPWLKQAAALQPRTVVDDHFQMADTVLSSVRSELKTAPVFSLPEAAFFSLDGHLFHRPGIDALVKEVVPVKDDQKVVRAKLITSLGKVENALVTAGKRGSPSAFYAILKMDGDSIGTLLSENPAHEAIIGKGLARFTQSVINMFKPGPSNDLLGALVYAGGDDVLAVLPVDTAIAAARRLRDAYTAAFAGIDGAAALKARLTLSGAIVFGHYSNPLTAMLRLAGDELDAVAKERNGRNSLALCVAKPGGVAARWVSCFGPDTTSDTSMLLDRVSKSGTHLSHDPLIAGGFFHALRDRYRPLFAARREPGAMRDARQPDTELPGGADDAMLKALIMAELARQFGGRLAGSDTLVETAGELASILRPKTGSGEQKQPGVSFDGGLVVRFLAMERRDQSSAEGGDHA